MKMSLYINLKSFCIFLIYLIILLASTYSNEFTPNTEISRSKGLGFAQYITGPQHQKLNSDEQLKTIIELGEKTITLVELYKRYVMYFKIVSFVDNFLDLYSAEQAKSDVILSMVKLFELEERRRTEAMTNYCKHLSTLTTQSDDSNKAKVFKRQWNDVTKTLKIDVKPKLNTKVSIDLEEAILRIWKAPNDTEALKYWKADHSIWSELAESDFTSKNELNVIQKLTNPSDHNLQSLKFNSETPLTLTDKQYAIALYRSPKRYLEKYQQCMWILTYSKNPYITTVKETFNHNVSHNSSEQSINDKFCSVFVNISSSISNANLFPESNPTKQDFEEYISFLRGKGIDTDGIKNVIRIMDLDSNHTTTVKP